VYGSIDGVKDNLPRFAKYIRPDDQITSELEIKESTVTGYLQEFSSQVDSALSSRYTVPISPAPDVIHSIVNGLASYKLARRFWTNISTEENFSISALRKDAKEILDSIVSGSYVLPGIQKTGTDVDELDEILQSLDSEETFSLEDPTSWQDKL
jgi:phage gp36-like protein